MNVETPSLQSVRQPRVGHMGTFGRMAGLMPWHQILHSWNRRVLDFSERFHLQSWSETCLRQCWKFASYVASLPSRIWVRRALEWFPTGTRVGRPRVGRPPNTWCTQLEAFARVMGWEGWTAYARHSRDWQHACDAFVNFAKNDVQCLKSSACTTNSKLEFRSAPAPLRGRLPACRLTD